MENAILGAVCGAGLMMIFILFILIPISPKWMEENRAIVYTTDHGVVCKENGNYPNLNCLLVKKAVGPKLNIFVIDGDK